MTYYNDTDPFVVEWLRALIVARVLPPGEVDERSIVDVTAADLRGFDACHFFAGVGGWARALQLAQWPDARAVWTGSCPCQPFSMAGEDAGTDDARHLWPSWFSLIAQCRPPVVFGEQVASAAGLHWLDLVLADLEHADYAVGRVVLPAACVGAPHRRSRLWFVADDDRHGQQERETPRLHADRQAGHDAAGRGQAERVDESDLAGLEGFAGHGDDGPQPGWLDAPAAGPSAATGVSGFWADAEWLPCRDGVSRPVEPGTFPLAHGVPGRVGRLRAYGNAIVPQVAAALIAAYLSR